MTFWRHERGTKSKKKWNSRKFGSKKRDCPSKIGTVGKYARGGGNWHFGVYVCVCGGGAFLAHLLPDSNGSGDS